VAQQAEKKCRWHLGGGTGGSEGLGQNKHKIESIGKLDCGKGELAWRASVWRSIAGVEAWLREPVPPEVDTNAISRI
jgi:hypothetical protein